MELILVFLLISNIILGSLRDIYNKKILKSINPLDYQLGYILATNIIFGLIGLGLGWFSRFHINFLMILNAAITALALIFYFKAIKMDDISKISPLENLNILFIFIIAVIFLKEPLNFQMIIGILALLFGVYIIHLQTSDFLSPFREIPKSKSFRYILAFSFLMGLNRIFAKMIIPINGPMTYFFLYFNFCFVFYLLYLLFIKYNIKEAIKNCLKLKRDIFSVSYLASLENITYYAALSIGMVSQVSSISRASSLLTVFLGSIIFKEKSMPYRLLGASIVFFAALVLITVN